jgi:hypothetical protein
MHRNITCNNFFLNKNLDLKVGNFTNSKIFLLLDNPSILKMEVFEFGLALYKMSTGIKLYYGRSLEEKEEALRLMVFQICHKLRDLRS